MVWYLMVRGCHLLFLIILYLPIKLRLLMAAKKLQRGGWHEQKGGGKIRNASTGAPLWGPPPSLSSLLWHLRARRGGYCSYKRTFLESFVIFLTLPDPKNRSDFLYKSLRENVFNSFKLFLYSRYFSKPAALPSSLETLHNRLRTEKGLKPIRKVQFFNSYAFLSTYVPWKRSSL